MVTSAAVRSRAASARSRTSRAQTRVLFGCSRASQSGWLLGDLLGEQVLRGASSVVQKSSILSMRSRPGRGAAPLQRRDMILVGFEPESRTSISTGQSAAGMSEAAKNHPPALSRVSSDRCRSCCDSCAIAVSRLPARRSRVRARRVRGSRRRSPRGRSVGGGDDGRFQRLASALSGLAEASAARPASTVEKLRGRRLVEHGEARADIGLERELMQQPRAEGVDGLHLQAARRLQRRGKQPPRPRALRASGLRPVES